MLMRLLFVLLCGLSAWGTWIGLRKRFPDLRQRRNDLRLDDLGRRSWRLVTEVLLQVRVIRNRPLVGLLHGLVVWGFMAFVWVSIRHVWAGLAGLEHAPGPGGAYRAFVAGWAVLVAAGILGLAFRRFVLRPAALGAPSWSSAAVAALIVVLMATYLLDWSGTVRHGSAPWQAVWWLHTLALLAFPPLIVRSKHLHLALGPVAVFFRSATTSPMRPLDLGPENFEKETPDLGLVELGQLPWKDVVDLNACVECGRCTDACPAHRSGGTLSPKEVVLQMQRGLERGATTIAGSSAEVAAGAAWVAEEDLVQCYACGACEEACPVGIEHLGRKILDLRHGLVNNERLADKRIPKTFGKMQKAPHNPWGLPADLRRSFVADAKLPTFAEGAEVLFWMGCGISYDPHGQEVARAMGTILDASGVSWGVLEQESCCGEPARRLGNEALFQELSGKVVASFKRFGVKRIVTCCPHCTVMLDADYRHVADYAGLGIRVMHHTEFLAEMMPHLPLLPDGGTVAYHDPCNLARGRNVTAEPRAVLEACGARLLEPREHGRAAMCCGAGGGQMFVTDESKEASARTRVNVLRLDDLLAAKPERVAVACPYCPIMLRDAAQARGSQVPIVDIAEIVAGRLARAKGDGVMTGMDLVIGGSSYQYLPNGTEFPYLGPDGTRYRQHENGGGLVAQGSQVAASVHVGPLTRVFGTAELSQSVRLTGRAEVGGTVKACGSVVFCGQTLVTDGTFSGSRIVKRERPLDALRATFRRLAS
jgi:Fe-S oxidoreductase